MKQWDIQYKEEFNLPVWERILKVRSLSEQELVDQKYHDPMLMKDMDKAVSLLDEAIKAGKRILIWGDYDADGIMSTSVLYLALKELGADVDYHIPLRENGYGINIRGVKPFLIYYDVFLTCDNGIAANEAVDFLKKEGKTVIITDHHEPQESIPNADAIVNPMQEDCAYPFEKLAGCAVAWKTAQAIERYRTGSSSFTDDLKEFAAIGTVVDMMPLKGENRVLVKEGLVKLKNTTNKGLRALLRVLDIENEPELSTYHLGFKIGPCLNATGRLVSATDAVDMCVHPYKFKAYKLAKYMMEVNEERKALCQEWEMKLREEVSPQDNFLLLYHPDIPEGIVGIIAGRIKEEYNRPTVVLTNSGTLGVIKGSGRSIDSVSIFDMLGKYKNLLVSFGGHHGACGLGLKVEKLAQLKALLNSEEIKLEPPTLRIDTLVTPDELTEELCNQIKTLAPFGLGNPQPVFGILQAEVEQAKDLSGGKHLKMKINIAGKQFDVIGFNQWKQYCDIGQPKWVDLAFHAEINEWMGRRNVQLKLKDFKSAYEPQLA